MICKDCIHGQKLKHYLNSQRRWCDKHNKYAIEVRETECKGKDHEAIPE